MDQSMVNYQFAFSGIKPNIPLEILANAPLPVRSYLQIFIISGFT